LINEAAIGEQLAGRTDIYVAIPIKDEIGSAEFAISPGRLVPDRYVRADLVIHKPLEQPGHAINGITCEPLRPKIKAALNAVQHCLGDGDLLFAIGTRALGVQDDPVLVVDEVVRIIGKEGVDAFPRDPCRLRIG
jgi:hypothetical protein